MRLLANENISATVVRGLRREGHDVLSAKESMRSEPDKELLARAQAEGRILVTHDKDFGELVYRCGRATHGVLLIRLAGLSPAAKAELVSAVVRDRGGEMVRAFSVVSPGQVRVRRLT